MFNLELQQTRHKIFKQDWLKQAKKKHKSLKIKWGKCWQLIKNYKKNVCGWYIPFPCFRMMMVLRCFKKKTRKALSGQKIKFTVGGREINLPHGMPSTLQKTNCNTRLVRWNRTECNFHSRKNFVWRMKAEKKSILWLDKATHLSALLPITQSVKLKPIAITHRGWNYYQQTTLPSQTSINQAYEKLEGNR